MGRDATATGQWQGQTGQGKAYLETDFVRFSGPFRAKLDFKACHTIAADGGWLRFEAPDGVLALELGENEAARWLDRIQNPPSLGQKLGLKPGQAVRVMGPIPVEVEAELARIGAPVTANAALVLLAIDLPDGLGDIDACAESLASGQDLWIVFEKGRRDVTGTDVIQRGRTAGLTDTKVCRVSETLTGQRFRKRHGAD